MLYDGIKILISAIILVIVSEVAKRSSLIGAAIASLPLTSLLAMLWIYIDTHNANIIVELSNNIFWLILPSLVLFIAFPILIKYHWNFYLALTTSCILMMSAYFLMIIILNYFKIKI